MRFVWGLFFFFFFLQQRSQQSVTVGPGEVVRWKRKESLREEVDKVGEASRNGRRKRSKAELEVRNRADARARVRVWRRRERKGG